MSFKQTELDRRLGNAIKYGTVEEVDYANAKVKVKIGDLTTAWIPWTTKSSNNSAWLAPEIGEQVVMASPSGELNQGCIIGSLPQDLHPPVGDSADKHTMTYGDGAVIEYDRAAHHLKAVLPAGGTVEIVADGGVTISATGGVTVIADDISITGRVAIEGDTTITGNLSVDGNITATGTITP